MIKNILDCIALNNGMKMPGYGFGVYKADGNELEVALAEAFNCGYRYIDTASFYKNEKIVGKAVKRSGLPRESLFIVSKIWPSQFHDAVVALEESLENLELDYLDGYLLHWPGLNEYSRLKAFEALLRQQESGKIRVLGVSNFLRQHLEGLHKNFNIWAPVNQIEVHPLFQQKELCDFCAEHSIKVVSWSPLGRGGAINLHAIKQIAGELGRAPAQIILRWHIQNNYVPIPKSIHAERIRENADVFNFELNQRQMKIIDSLELPDKKGRTGKDPLAWPPDDAI